MRLWQTSGRAMRVTIIHVSGILGLPARARGDVPLERTATKLNADKTRFDPRPVGVLLTFRFRDCSRPLPVRYERTPSVPGCQYPFRDFRKVHPDRKLQNGDGKDTPGVGDRPAGATSSPVTRIGHRGRKVVTPLASVESGLWAEAVEPAISLRRLTRCSPKAERRQSRLASKPSAFCWLSASGIAPVRV